MKFTNLLLNLSLITSLFLIASCSDDDDDNGGEVAPVEERRFNIAAEVSDGGNAITTYIATTPDLNTGNLSFVGNGLELNATRAARVIAQGNYIYNLDYGGGIIYQYEVLKDGTYSLVKELDVNVAIGTAYPRYKVVDENTIMLHNVVVNTEYEEDGTTIKSVTPTMYAVAIQIPELTVRTIMEPTTIAQTTESVAKREYGFRVDAPVVSGGKIYYGLMRTIDGIGRGGSPASGLETIVMDYPSLTNLKVVRSSANTSGHTNGYRAPSMHVDESGDIYQSNQFMSRFGFNLSAGSKTVISRLRNGNYDDSYDFNVSQALGEEVSTAGWFYVGNGIGYMPILLEDIYAAGGEDNYWSVARIDLKNKTAVKLNIPVSDLLSYQSAVVTNDKFYMAISPIGGDAKVYEFDINSTSPDAFKEALDLDDGNIFIQGIY